MHSVRSRKSSSPPAIATSGCRKSRSRSRRSTPTKSRCARSPSHPTSHTAVPNASFRPAQAAFGNTMTAFVRGIGQYDFDFAFEPGVAIYVDDMYHPFTLGSQIAADGSRPRRGAARTAGHALRARLDRRRHPLRQQEAAGRRFGIDRAHATATSTVSTCAPPTISRSPRPCPHASPVPRRRGTATRTCSTSRAYTRAVPACRAARQPGQTGCKSARRAGPTTSAVAACCAGRQATTSRSC